MPKVIETDFSGALHVRNPHGAIMIDGQHVADTLRCCHCGKVWIPIKGSKRQRGWCFKCNDVTCGPKCASICLSIEKRLDLVEKGKMSW